ncbi:hypothetical protein [Leucobacter sp. OH1287]|uniref:hypothetical protein n=1 Tax=Leucobacter sp. OH1287 TaxID=2491049 RepID=UPI000F5E84E9|nr:hypothetical protein [Leucobacter sp. OH1287]RRD59960.1 hypothetical protein EII30_07475 [Leucobacter sp. OH1287]
MATKATNVKAKETAPETSPAVIDADFEKETQRILDSMPRVKPFASLRLKELNVITGIMNTFMLTQKKHSGMTETDKQLIIIDCMGDLDDFLASVAEDPEAYLEWSIQHRNDIEMWSHLLAYYMKERSNLFTSAD